MTAVRSHGSTVGDRRYYSVSRLIGTVAQKFCDAFEFRLAYIDRDVVLTS
jgi:hypothetical protein